MAYSDTEAHQCLCTPASLPTRTLGTAQVTVVGMGLSTAPDPPAADDARSAFLDALHARGCTFWDTADVDWGHRGICQVRLRLALEAADILTARVLAGQERIKYVGICECSAETLRRAHATHPISAVQTEYSLAELIIEHNGLLAACRELGIPVVPLAPLGKGLLAGQYVRPSPA